MLKPLAVLFGASMLALAANAAPNSNLDASPTPSAPQTQPAAPAPTPQPVPGPAYEQPAAPEAAADQSAPVQTASPAVVAAAPPQHDWWLLIPVWLTAIFTGGILVFAARLHGVAKRLLGQQRLP